MIDCPEIYLAQHKRTVDQKGTLVQQTRNDPFAIVGNALLTVASVHLES